MCRNDRQLGQRRIRGVSGATPADGTLGFRTRSTSTSLPLLKTSLALCVLAGCVQEMSDQPRYDPLEANPAYVDNVLSQTPVPGTVARGQLELDTPFFTGKADGEFVKELPPRVLAERNINEVLASGRERYTIFCSHCHGQVGGGFGGDASYASLVGMVVQRGYPAPPTYHQERLRHAPIGHFFDIITNGTALMPSHDYLIPPQDRWAIAAYIRALQLSQLAPRDLLSVEDLQRLSDRPAL